MSPISSPRDTLTDGDMQFESNSLGGENVMIVRVFCFFNLVFSVVAFTDRPYSNYDGKSCGHKNMPVSFVGCVPRHNQQKRMTSKKAIILQRQMPASCVLSDMQLKSNALDSWTLWYHLLHQGQKVRRDSQTN